MPKSKTSKKDERPKDVQPEVKRMNLNVETSLHDAFKAVTAAEGKNMTNVLIEFIKEYVTKHGVPAGTKKGRKQ